MCIYILLCNERSDNLLNRIAVNRVEDPNSSVGFSGILPGGGSNPRSGVNNRKDGVGHMINERTDSHSRPF